MQIQRSTTYVFTVGENLQQAKEKNSVAQILKEIDDDGAGIELAEGEQRRMSIGRREAIYSCQLIVDPFGECFLLDVFAFVYK